MKHPLLNESWPVIARELAFGHYLMGEAKEAEQHEQQAETFERQLRIVDEAPPLQTLRP